MFYKVSETTTTCILSHINIKLHIFVKMICNSSEMSVLEKSFVKFAFIFHYHYHYEVTWSTLLNQRPIDDG